MCIRMIALLSASPAFRQLRANNGSRAASFDHLVGAGRWRHHRSSIWRSPPATNIGCRTLDACSICLGQEVAGQRADRVDGRQHTRAVGAPDRQIAGVVLEQDTGMIADWTGMIITAYVGGRSIEKVARVFARRP